MTNKQSHDDGTLSDEERTWLQRRAAGGFGLVCTCAAHVVPEAKTWDGELGIWDDRHIEGLRGLAEGIRADGALSIVQIFHGGYRTPRRVSGVQPVSASAFTIDAEGFEQPRELRTAEVEALVHAFVRAAVRAEAAGLDGVEIHGAHTYLVSQFLSREINTRTDGWGGSLEGRYRFLGEVLRGIRERCSADFVVGVRLSPGVPAPHAGMNLEETLDILPWIEADGADFVHMSLKEAGDVQTEAGADVPVARTEPVDERVGSVVLPVARRRLCSRVCLMAAGGVTDRSAAERALSHGADMVAIGRAAIGNAAWPQMIEKGEAIAQPPYSVDHLVDQGLSAPFVEYMRRWPGFVKE